MGATLAVWQPHPDVGPITSLAGGLDRALRIPGAATAMLGELPSDGTLAIVQHPDAPAGLAHQAARSSLAYARGGEPPQELVLTGDRYISLLQTTPVPAGGHAFVQVTLVRAEANLALARMGLPEILLALPALLALQRIPALPERRRTSTPPPRRQSVPKATLQQILERLKSL